MSASKVRITPKDILLSAKHNNGDILDFKANEFRDNKTVNKKAIYDVTWIPIYFKYIESINGKSSTKLVPLKNIEFSKVITSSGLKLPQIQNGDNLKCMLLTFKKLTWDELYGGDYVEKEYDNPEEQELQNKKFKQRMVDLLENTNEFVEALDCIAVGHQLLCNKLKQQANTLKFKIKKDKSHSNENIPVRSIRQTHREKKEDEDIDEDSITLASPLYRIKLPVYDGQLVKHWFKKGTKEVETKNYIFDARRTIFTNNKVEQQPPIIKVNGKIKPLDIHTAPSFLTFKSEIAGLVSFPEIIASKNGLSLQNQFENLLVRRHKSKQVQSDINTKVALSMLNPDSESDEIEINDKQSNNKIDDNNLSDDVGEEKSRVPVKSQQLNKKVLPNKKSESIIISDEDDDFNLE
jgi:hypothetical protein